MYWTCFETVQKLPFLSRVQHKRPHWFMTVPSYFVNKLSKKLVDCGWKNIQVLEHFCGFFRVLINTCSDLMAACNALFVRCQFDVECLAFEKGDIHVDYMCLPLECCSKVENFSRALRIPLRGKFLRCTRSLTLFLPSAKSRELKQRKNEISATLTISFKYIRWKSFR
jgi:hypothetical protein